MSVSFRKPNRKWKVARHVLAERLRITWENTCRVRALAQEVLGYDLDFDNLDQSPFHMNEAGSQAQKSLSIRGGGVVPLKEGHAQTSIDETASLFLCSLQGVNDKTKRNHATPPIVKLAGVMQTCNELQDTYAVQTCN